MSQLWNTSEPPKDRRIVAIGTVEFNEDGLTQVDPFCEIIHFSAQSGQWVNEVGLTIRKEVCDRLYIHFWAELPVLMEVAPGEVLSSPEYPCPHCGAMSLAIGEYADCQLRQQQEAK